MPREAASGLRLCDLCTRLLGEHALEAVQRHVDCERVLAAGVVVLGDKLSTRDELPVGVNLAAVEARELVRSTLVRLAAVVVGGRGVSAPDRADVLGLGTLVARHHVWLAAHIDAGNHATLLREVARGKPWRVAFPGGTRLFLICLPDGGPAACPERAEENGQWGPCPGLLWAVLRHGSNLLPSQLACNGETQHAWPVRDWLKLGARLRGQGQVAA